MQLSTYVDLFKRKKIMVIGDIMLDKYIWGEVNRISPEAPVQIVNVMEESFVAGGAANVAVNLSDLGSQVIMVGVVGNDQTREMLLDLLQKKGIDISGIVPDPEKPTITKVRVFGKKQQLLRFDYEKAGNISSKTQERIVSLVAEKIKIVDAIIVSDYAKGVITQDIMKAVIQLCKEHKKIIVVDPKPEHRDFYINTTLITPNHAEAQKMSNFPELSNTDKDVEVMGKQLVKYLNCSVLITRGEKGMSLFEKSGTIRHIPTFAKEVFDIIGAGDTAVAAVTLALASNASYGEAAIIANHAAGITVGKVGTSTVSPSELKESMKDE